LRFGHVVKQYPNPETYRAFVTGTSSHSPLVFAHLLSLAVLPPRLPLQDDVFQNTFGFGRDSNKAAKELAGFEDTMFNINAGEAAAPMEVGVFWGCGVCVCVGWGLEGG